MNNEINQNEISYTYQLQRLVSALDKLCDTPDHQEILAKAAIAQLYQRLEVDARREVEANIPQFRAITGFSAGVPEDLAQRLYEQASSINDKFYNLVRDSETGKLDELEVEGDHRKFLRMVADNLGYCDRLREYERELFKYVDQRIKLDASDHGGINLYGNEEYLSSVVELFFDPKARLEADTSCFGDFKGAASRRHDIISTAHFLGHENFEVFAGEWMPEEAFVPGLVPVRKVMVNNSGSKYAYWGYDIDNPSLKTWIISVVTQYQAKTKQDA